jgi:hypothetical protein
LSFAIVAYFWELEASYIRPFLWNFERVDDARALRVAGGAR